MVSQHLVVVSRFTQTVPEADLLPGKGSQAVAASHADLGERYLYFEGDIPLLFTENETNNERLFGTVNPSPYVKDGINNYVVHGNHDSVNPGKTGTKSSAQYQLNVDAGKTAIIRVCD